LPYPSPFLEQSCIASASSLWDDPKVGLRVLAALVLYPLRLDVIVNVNLVTHPVIDEVWVGDAACFHQCLEGLSEAVERELVAAVLVFLCKTCSMEEIVD
jgi:hypothetical protein